MVFQSLEPILNLKSIQVIGKSFISFIREVYWKIDLVNKWSYFTSNGIFCYYLAVIYETHEKITFIFNNKALHLFWYVCICISVSLYLRLFIIIFIFFSFCSNLLGYKSRSRINEIRRIILNMFLNFPFPIYRSLRKKIKEKHVSWDIDWRVKAWSSGDKDDRNRYYHWICCFPTNKFCWRPNSIKSFDRSTITSSFAFVFLLISGPVLEIFTFQLYFSYMFCLFLNSILSYEMDWHVIIRCVAVLFLVELKVIGNTIYTCKWRV